MTIQTHPVPTAPTPAYQDTPYQFTERDVSDVAEALNFLLSALECPRSVRVLLHALLGFVAGQADKVEFFHWDIARRAFSSRYVNKSEFGAHRAELEERVRKTIQSMRLWCSKWDGLPITYTPGGKRDGEGYPSCIELPLLTWATHIANKARQTPDWSELTAQERGEVFRKAVAALLKRKGVMRLEKPAEREKQKQSRTQIYRTLLTTAERYVERKTSEDGQQAADVINSLIWDLASKLEKKFSTFPLQKGGEELPVEETAAGPEEEDVAGNSSTYNKSTLGVEFSDDYTEEIDHGAADQGDPLDTDGAARTGPPWSTEYELDDPLTDAQTTVAGFHSVGVTAFGLTLPKAMTTTGKDYQVLPADQVSRDIDVIIDEAERRGWKLSMIRPCRVPGLAIIQCDDPTANLEELSEKAFLDVNTSPHSKGQSWVAVRLDKLTEEDAARYVKKYFGADMRASGSMRCPGSRNRKYDPAPLVRVRTVQAGLILEEADIAHMIPAPVERSARPLPRRSKGAPYVPDWQRVAAMHPGATPSHIDYYCALGGLQNGVSEADVTEWLIDNSQDIDGRKRSYAKTYAERTTRAAMAYLSGRV